MSGLSYEEIVTKISMEKGLTREDVQGRVKLKLNQLSDLISKEGAAHIIANELGVRVYTQTSVPRRVKINELNPAMKGVEVVARVTRVFEIRTFQSATRQGRVANLSIADDTGFSRLVLWDEKQLKDLELGKIKEGDIVKISNGYVKDNAMGGKEVHLGSQGSLVVNPEGETVVARVASGTMEAQRKYIKELTENDQAVVIGTVVQLFEPRFYDSCPTCGKKIEFKENGFSCTQHGIVQSVPQPVLNIVFDDGTENIRIVCFRDNVKKVLDIDDVVSLKDNPDKFRDVQRKVAGKQLKIQGRVNRNTFFDRLEMVANSVEEANPKELAMELRQTA